MGPDRERDRAVADGRRLGVRTRLVAVGFAIEAGVRQRLRIVDAGPHALGLELVDDLLAPVAQALVEHGDEAVVAGAPVAVVAGLEHAQLVDLRQARRQRVEVALARLEEAGQALHLLDAERGADLAEPVVEAQVLDLVGAGVAAVGQDALVDPERALLGDAVGDVVVPGDDHAALAGRDVLDRIEGEAADVADQADVRRPCSARRARSRSPRRRSSRCGARSRARAPCRSAARGSGRPRWRGCAP